MSQLFNDLHRIHLLWMSLLYPRQLNQHSVTGRWKPESVVRVVGFRLWGVLSVPVVGVSYALFLLGMIFRHAVETAVAVADKAGISLTVFGFGLFWLGISLALYNYTDPAQTLAFAVSAVVALVCLTISILSQRRFGAVGTVLVSYPTAYNSVFLPPITAAVTTSADILAPILPTSYSIAVVVLNALPTPLSSFLRSTFQIDGGGHLLMWVGISIVVGWTTGILFNIFQIATLRLRDISV